MNVPPLSIEQEHALRPFHRLFDPAARVAVFDVEIFDDPQRTGGWERTDLMGISVTCCYEYQGRSESSKPNWGRFTMFGDMMAPSRLDPVTERASDASMAARGRTALIEKLLSADVVGGFNIWSFDLPIVFGVSRQVWAAEHRERAPGLAEKCIDLFRLARLGHSQPLEGPCCKGLNLESCAQATLGYGKTGDGKRALTLWAERRLLELHQYCLDDVRGETELFEFARSNFYFKTGAGTCPVNPDPLWGAGDVEANGAKDGGIVSDGAVAQ